jgi:hypothetical protein
MSFRTDEPDDFGADDDGGDTIACPKCKLEIPDMDGMGWHGRCEGCGYCDHPAITGEVCDECGADVFAPDDEDERRHCEACGVALLIGWHGDLCDVCAEGEL